MINHDLIRLHVAMMYRHVFRPFLGEVVTDRLAYDLLQAGHDLHRDLSDFVANIGEPDSSQWEDEMSDFVDDEFKEEFKEEVEETNNMLSITREVANLG